MGATAAPSDTPFAGDAVAIDEAASSDAPAALAGLGRPERIALERAAATGDARYQPRLDEAGPVLVAPADPGRVVASFGPTGARVPVGDRAVRIQGTAIGRAGTTRALSTEGVPSIEGPEIRTMRGDGVTEWWRSLPSGLEHGFTVEERPEGDGALVLEIAFDGISTRERSASAIELLDAGGALVATYRDLVVTDAVGGSIPARMSATETGVRLIVDDAGARYPIEIDPTLGMFIEHTVASNEGNVRAFDATGLRAVSFASPGVAAVHVRSGTTWAREYRTSGYTPSAATIDGAGSTILVSELGVQVHVYTRSGTVWTAGSPILPPGTVSTFGARVAISGDGARAFVGQPAFSRVYVFAGGGGSFALEATLNGSSGFGDSLAVSDDGSRLLGGESSAGARVFRRSGTTWSEEIAFAVGQVYDVSIASDASRLALSTAAGGVRVFVRIGSWTLERSIAGATGDDRMLSGSGSRLALRESGRLSIWDRSGTTWTATSRFGDVVGGRLSPDGNRAGWGSEIYRIDTPIATGAPCAADDECASDHCVDGVCCASACTGGAMDCQACSMALTGMPNGTCAALSAAVAPTVTCRAAAGFCDVAERCVSTSVTCPTDARQPTTLECRPASPGVPCDSAEYCDGGTACPPADSNAPMPSGTICRASTGACDPDERCDGVTRTCPADLLSPNGTSCGGATSGCTMGGICNGTSPSCPSASLQPAGHVCLPRDPANPCDVDDVCDGTTDICQARFAPVSTTCGLPPSGACDTADHCAGTSAYCVPTFLAGVECRPSAGACDIADVCTGSAPDCPPDGRLSAGVLCRDAIGGCDLAEYCTGAAACPADGFRATGASCRPSTTPCDVAEVCTGAAAECPIDGFAMAGTVCNGFILGPCDVADVCSGSDGTCLPAYRSGIVCRPTAGACDVAESCTGGSDQCPPDTYLGAGEACGSAGGSCATPGTCNGTTATCPGATLLAAGTVCAPADPTRPCDVDDICTGTSDACPATFRAAGTECLASSGEVCDAPDVCTGTSADCMPTFLAGVECRAASGGCDAPETCTGASATCPPDVVEAAGMACRPAAAACDPVEVCDGTSSTCPVDVIECDGGGVVGSDGGMASDGGPISDGGSGIDVGVGADLPPAVAATGCGCRARGQGDRGAPAAMVLAVAAVLSTRRRAR